MTYHMTMDKSKETRGTVVFLERVDEDQRPHQFYVLKDTYKALGSPDTIDCTISATTERE